MIALPEKARHFLWSIFGAIGIICFWAGIWDGIGTLPYLESPWISLAVGMAIIISTGVFFKEFDPLEEAEKAVGQVLHKVHRHPRKHEFHIKYQDKILKKEMVFRADQLKGIEKGILVFLHKDGSEIFVPSHRVTEVLHKGRTYWKGSKAK